MTTLDNKIWLTSDNHFFHKNVLKFCPNSRQGKDEVEMNERMIAKWNSQVSRADTIYCLGDFSFGDSFKTEQVLKRLNGQIHLIRGNHENWLNKNPSLEKYFISVSTYKEVTIDGIKVVMFHYPIAEWNQMHRGSFHVFGHVHNSIKNPKGRCMDVGIDARPQCDMGLFSWEEVKATLSAKEILKHHDKELE